MLPGPSPQASHSYSKLQAPPSSSGASPSAISARLNPSKAATNSPILSSTAGPSPRLGPEPTHLRSTTAPPPSCNNAQMACTFPIRLPLQTRLPPLGSRSPGWPTKKPTGNSSPTCEAAFLPPRARPQTTLHPNLPVNDQQQPDIEQHGSLKLHNSSNTAPRLPQASHPKPHGSTPTSSFTTTAPRLYSVMTPPCSGAAPGKSLLHSPDIIHPVHPSNYIKKQHHVKEEHHLESFGKELAQEPRLLQPKMDN